MHRTGPTRRRRAWFIAFLTMAILGGLLALAGSPTGSIAVAGGGTSSSSSSSTSSSTSTSTSTTTTRPKQEGCTPGYWKQKQHFDSWKWYTQADMLDAVFGIASSPFRSTQRNNPSGALTLLEALELNGNGGEEQLFRHGTAALLNSVYQSGVSFPYTAPQVITMVRTAWRSGDAAQIAATHKSLAAANERSCPLN